MQARSIPKKIGKAKRKGLQSGSKVAKEVFTKGFSMLT
jgi:hypothetical protein